MSRPLPSSSTYLTAAASLLWSAPAAAIRPTQPPLGTTRRLLGLAEDDETPVVVHRQAADISVTLRGGAESSDKDAASKKSKSRRKRKTKPKADDDDDASSTTSNNNPILEEILQTDDYYQILGTTKQAVMHSQTPDKDIQKAYRKRAVQTHPDKTGGDRRAFDKVAEAYDILQDEDKRNMYNQYGKERVQQHQQYGGGSGSGMSGMSGMQAEDLFRSFFGGGKGQQQHPFANNFQRYQQRFQLPVTLEDMYRGRSTSVQLPNGQTIQVDIPRGAYDQQELTTTSNDDDDETQYFVLQQRSHATFVRKNHDLAVTISISLSEALTGLQRRIRHLSGQSFHIVSAPNNNESPRIIQTGDVHVYKGQGMPKDSLGTEFGDLYVQYKVQMPTASGTTASLTPEERQQLQTLLQKLEGKPTNHKKQWPFGRTEDLLAPADIADFGRASGQLPRPQQQQQQQGFSSGFSPFGQQRFYWSSGQQSSNPFFGDGGPMDNNDEDAAQQQCRQM